MTSSMSESLEVRWFGRGEVPCVISRILFSKPLIVEVRTDFYLRLEGACLGIKLRDRSLEIKKSRGDKWVERVSDSVTGYAATWRKWTFPLASSFLLPSKSTDWLSVQKTRNIATFSLNSLGMAEVVAPKSFPGEGCNVELAELQVGTEKWWTLCFDAFGSSERMLFNLLTVAQRELKEVESSLLPLSASLDYPSWLNSQVY